ncbi:MAG: transglycosylase domain-containing protein, partial [Paraprevotella sp.]|nr:transglycosylase domain-containing protein [Paraprevotella sp.]
MSKDNNETKRVKTTKKVKNSKSKKEKKVSKFKTKHPKLAKGIKIAIIVLIVGGILGAGALVGAFIGLFGDELKIDEAMLKVGYENSTVYDADGNLIATLSGDAKRKSITLGEMSEYLPKAYVAIEDERFYEHGGIDIGRTAYAT